MSELEWIEKCKSSEKFEKFLSKESLDLEILNDAIRVIHTHSSSFDIWQVKRTNSPIRFGRKDLKSKNGHSFGLFRLRNGRLTIKFNKRYCSEPDLELQLNEDLESNENLILKFIGRQRQVIERKRLSGNGYWPTKFVDEDSDELDDEDDHEFDEYEIKANTHCSLNSIIYGPPGTGKTYNSVNRVMEIIDPSFSKSQSESNEDRAAVKSRFDAAVEDGQVEFITFHQSFGYEEFIEGLRAKTVNGEIQYSVEPGVFKRICKRASETSSDITIDQAMTDFLGVIVEEPIKLTTPTGKTFSVAYNPGRSTISCSPEASKEGTKLPANIEHIKSVIAGITPDRIYCESYVAGIANYLREEYKLEQNTEVPDNDNSKPYVLVIDEINRGNISKIFGELITLIEPSKRLGEDEALTVKLPYSGDVFGVPKNLYIIGTMNTADRSLAMMDTALRRRFDFVEMMPVPSLLKGVVPVGIRLDLLLSTMNQRIEYLYDREHTLGHAFFIPVKSAWNKEDHEAAFRELKQAFKNKVLPLLEEYFFEDWSKIRLVLGDNQVPKELQFITEDRADGKLQQLFGNSYSEDQFAESSASYAINAKAFDDPRSYIKIYQAISPQPASSEVSDSLDTKGTSQPVLAEIEGA